MYPVDLKFFKKNFSPIFKKYKKQISYFYKYIFSWNNSVFFFLIEKLIKELKIEVNFKQSDFFVFQFLFLMYYSKEINLFLKPPDEEIFTKDIQTSLSSFRIEKPLVQNDIFDQEITNILQNSLANDDFNNLLLQLNFLNNFNNFYLKDPNVVKFILIIWTIISIAKLLNAQVIFPKKQYEILKYNHYQKLTLGYTELKLLDNEMYQYLISFMKIFGFKNANINSYFILLNKGVRS